MKELIITIHELNDIKKLYAILTKLGIITKRWEVSIRMFVKGNYEPSIGTWGGHQHEPVTFEDGVYTIRPYGTPLKLNKVTHPAYDSLHIQADGGLMLGCLMLRNAQEKTRDAQNTNLRIIEDKPFNEALVEEGLIWLDVKAPVSAT